MNSTLYRPNHIRTYTGRYVNLLDPDPSTINIIDIAHALSNQCRFAGHIPSFYSVAEHSIAVSNLVDDTHALAALMHDAAEAYLLDIPRPLKALLPQYETIETKFLSVIAAVFGFQYPFNPQIIEYDNFMLEYEWNHYVINPNDFSERVHKTPDLAKNLFLKEFNKLSKMKEQLSSSKSYAISFSSAINDCTEISSDIIPFDKILNP